MNCAICQTLQTPAGCIRITGDKLSGTISTLAYEIDISGEATDSLDGTGLAFQLFGKSPKGRTVKVGAAWIRSKRSGPREYMLSLQTGHGSWHARLYLIPNSDALYEVVPTEYLNSMI